MGMRRCWDDGAGVGNTRVVSPEPNRFHGGDEMRYRMDVVWASGQKDVHWLDNRYNDLAHMVRCATRRLKRCKGSARWLSAHITQVK